MWLSYTPGFFASAPKKIERRALPALEFLYQAGLAP